MPCGRWSKHFGPHGHCGRKHAANLRRTTTAASFGARSAAFTLPRASDAACAPPRVGPLGNTRASDSDRRHLGHSQQQTRPERLRRRFRLAERRRQGLRRTGHGLAGELLARGRAVGRHAPSCEGPSQARPVRAATDPQPHDPPARLEPGPSGGPADPGHRSSDELDASSPAAAQLACDLSSSSSSASTAATATATSASSTPTSSTSTSSAPSPTTACACACGGPDQQPGRQRHRPLGLPAGVHGHAEQLRWQHRERPVDHRCAPERHGDQLVGRDRRQRRGLVGERQRARADPRLQHDHPRAGNEHDRPRRERHR